MDESLSDTLYKKPMKAARRLHSTKIKPKKESARKVKMVLPKLKKPVGIISGTKKNASGVKTKLVNNTD